MLTRMLLASTFLVGISAPALSADPVQAIAPLAPASDMQGVSGYVDLYAGIGTIDFGGPVNYDLVPIGGAGRANIWFSPTFALQLDAWGEGVSWDLPGNNSASYNSFGIGGHLAWRDPNSFAFGGLASVGDAAFGRWGNVGLEGQAYFGNFTLYGQAGYTFDISGNSGPGGSGFDVWYVIGEGRYFPMPNLMLAGHIGYDDFSCSGCGDASAIRWGADVEFQPGGSPVAGFLSYQGASLDTGGGPDIDEHVFLAGVKVLMGQDSLQANNNYGATFADHNPVYGKWNLRFLGLN